MQSTRPNENNNNDNKVYTEVWGLQDSEIATMSSIEGIYSANNNHHAGRGRPKTNKHNPEMSELTIQGPPIPEDLFWLYKHALVGETAVCNWNDVGAKNSRWVNVPEKQPFSLINLLERIARLENGLTMVLDVVYSSAMTNPDKDDLSKLIVTCLDEAKSFRQDYKRDNDRLRQAEQRLSNEQMRALRTTQPQKYADCDTNELDGFDKQY